MKKKDFLKHASGLWTACIAGTMPMAMCMVVHLGLFEGLCVLFRIKKQNTLDFSAPVFPVDVLRGFNMPAPVYPAVLTKALTYWRAWVDHPAIQYLFPFLTLAGALAFCAALPSITAELNPRLRANERVSDALGAATSQMFDLLRLAGEIVQRYMVIAIPIVVWHVWLHRKPQVQWSPWCGTGMVVLGAAYILSRVYHELRAKTWSGSPAMLIARVLIVLACFALPSILNEISRISFSGTSILFILAGVAFLFAPIISVGVDVTSWLQEYPRQSTPRAHILARLIALLDHLKKEGSRAWRSPPTVRAP